MPLPVNLPEERLQPERQASTVFAIDGTPIGVFKGAETQIEISKENIPDTIRRAVVAAEDHRFFKHRGVDWQAIGRALQEDVKAGEFVQGGSTITQQLIRNLYTGSERTMVRKAREALLSVQAERVLSKEDILARYLNTVYLGESTFGVEAASQSYFRKAAKDVSLSEAALLAGVIPAPSVFSPRANPELAEQKRQLVLDLLARYRMATPEEVAAARADRPVVHPPPRVETQYPFFMDYLRTYLLNVKGYTAQQIYGGSLRIETTFDPRLQAAAEAAVRRLDKPKDPEATLVAVEPQTGFVRALVGGRNWDASQVNLALGRLGGGSGRQAGSSFKPFVLATAFEKGMRPEKRYSAPSCARPKGFDKPVCNYGGAGYGSVDLRTGMHKSINTVFAKLIADVGVKPTAELAKRMGLKGIDLDAKLYGVLALGTQETSALEMASAYGVFANHGVRVEPTPVLRILDVKGKTVEDNRQPNGQRVPDRSGGRQRHLRPPGRRHQGHRDGGPTSADRRPARPARRRTGRTPGSSGYTPTLSTAVWMGHPGGNITMANVHGVPHVVGGQPAVDDLARLHGRGGQGRGAAAVHRRRSPAQPGRVRGQGQGRGREAAERTGGFDIPPARDAEGLPPGGPLWGPAPKPNAKAPPPGPKPTTSSTAPPPSARTAPRRTKKPRRRRRRPPPRRRRHRRGAIPAAGAAARTDPAGMTNGHR